MTTASAPLLTVSDLRKSFGGVEAVRGVSFDVRPGQLLALIGSNGAGKTTSFNCINGQLRPDGGHVTYNPQALSTAQRMDIEQSGELAHVSGSLHDITGRAPLRIAKLGIGRTFQITATFGALYRDEAMALLSLVGLDAQAERHTATLAYGDLKRLELAMALATDPNLLLMDEPTAGMGVGERDSLMRLTRDLAKQKNIGVLFTEHDMDAVFGYADWIIVMHRGEVIARGLPDSIKTNATVKSAYLGEGDHS